MGSSISVQITGFVGSDVVLKEVGEQRVASTGGQVRWHYPSGSTTEPPAYPQADCWTVPPSASSVRVER